LRRIYDNGRRKQMKSTESDEKFDKKIEMIILVSCLL